MTSSQKAGEKHALKMYAYKVNFLPYSLLLIGDSHS